MVIDNTGRACFYKSVTNPHPSILDVYRGFEDEKHNRIITAALGQIVTQFTTEGIAPHDWVIYDMSDGFDSPEYEIILYLGEADRSSGNIGKRVDVLVMYSDGSITTVPLYKIGCTEAPKLDELNEYLHEASSFLEAITKHHSNIEA